jgi:hypothetical protein
MGMLAFWFFAGPAGLVMVLSETYDLVAAIMGYACLMIFGPFHFGAWLGRGIFWLVHRRPRLPKQ